MLSKFSKAMLCVFIFLVFVQHVVFGQTVTMFHDNGIQKCMGFRTVHGLVTADHCATETSGVRWFQSDIRIVPMEGSDVYQIGHGEPEYFLDRRGHRIDVEVVESEELFWLINVTFYSGESGLPLFDNDGQVVAVVSGNQKHKRWLGRVSRLKIIDREIRTNRPLLTFLEKMNEENR